MSTIEPGYTAEDLQLLQGISTATISTQLFKVGLRNCSLVDTVALARYEQRMVGVAFTLRYIPAREDLDQLSAFDDYDHPQRRAVEEVGPGQVLVMDCRQQGRAASIGNILVARLVQRGAAGVVTDGTVRDAAGIREAQLPVFAAGTSPTTNLAVHHAVDLQVPIGCGGVAVYPGDVLVGDDDGVVCIPAALVATVACDGGEQERLEEFILAEVQSGAPLRGTYPPNSETLARRATQASAMP